ncbi:MAG TPA: hypothetical protein VEC76_15830 [Streptosporangiaceae bacterium]|nr:hypothetical protein [Streptosporangiaceae bacterium]
MPHCEVLTAAAVDEPVAVLPDGGLLDELLHPAATSVPATATSTAAVRVPGASFRVLT